MGNDDGATILRVEEFLGWLEQRLLKKHRRSLFELLTNLKGVASLLQIALATSKTIGRLVSESSELVSLKPFIDNIINILDACQNELPFGVEHQVTFKNQTFVPAVL